jgi:hypothetical protein
MSDAECFQWIVANNAQIMRDSAGQWTRKDGSTFMCNFTLASGNTQWAAAPTLKEAIEQAAKHQADHR